MRDVPRPPAVFGAYDTRTTPEDEEFNHILHEFEASLAAFEAQDPSFNEAYGVLTISQEQPSLKRVNWDINWLSPDGVDETYNRVFFLHENSFYWEQYGIKDFSFLRPASEGEGE